MNKAELELELENHRKAVVTTALLTAKGIEQDKEQLLLLHALLIATGVEIEGVLLRYSYAKNLTSFKPIEHLMEAGDQLGLDLAKWTTNDYPQGKNRDFHFMLPSMAHFTIAAYLGEQSNCTLVEVSRETVEQVKYRMECNEGATPKTPTSEADGDGLNF